MYSNLTRLVFLLLSVTLVFALVPAQGPPGGGGPGGGGGTDSNPNNPLNWVVTIAMTTPRVDMVDRYEYNWLGQIEHAVYVRTWNSGFASWHRNGVDMGFADFAAPIVDTVQYGQFSEYTAGWTVTAEWIGVGPAPATAPIVINSPLAVWRSFGGGGSVSNGVGGHAVTMPSDIGGYFGNMTYITDPMVVRVIAINSQTKKGTLQFSTEAHASNPAGQENGFIWTDFGTPSAWFDARTAFIFGNNTQIPNSRHITGTTLSATIHLSQDGMPMLVTNNAFSFFDNLDLAYNGPSAPRTWSYDEAVPQQAEILYGPNFTNSSNWDIGLPITLQDRITDVSSGFVWYEPTTLEFDVPFSFVISPTGNLLTSWELTGRHNASGGALDLANGWFSWETPLVPPALQRYMRDYYGQWREGPDGLLHVPNEQDATDNIVVEAVFSDGVHATSIRNVQYHPGLEDVEESEKRWTDFQVHMPYLSVPIGPSGGGGFFPGGIVPNDTGQALIYPKDFPYLYFYIDDVLDFTLSVVGLIPVSPEVPVVAKALLSLGLDLAGSGIPDTDIPAVATTVSRDTTYQSDICDSIYIHLFGYASWTEILEGESREDWHITEAKEFLATIMNPNLFWSARFRPGKERWFILRDEWSIGGFETRRVDEKSEPKLEGSDQFGFFYMSYATTSQGVQFPGN